MEISYPKLHSLITTLRRPTTRPAASTTDSTNSLEQPLRYRVPHRDIMSLDRRQPEGPHGDLLKKVFPHQPPVSRLSSSESRDELNANGIFPVHIYRASGQAGSSRHTTQAAA